MKHFQLLPHSADVRILAKGDNYRNLFAGALNGLCEVINPGYCENQNQPNIIVEFEIESIDVTSLLIDFLSEVLSLIHQNKALFCEVNFEKLTDCYLKAIIKGSKVDEFEEDVKAVTYHEANIIHVDEIYQTIIVLDI